MRRRRRYGGMNSHNLPESATALWLADRTAETGDTVFLTRGVARLERLARSCAGFCAGRVELLVLPPWDVLPYDQGAPSAGVIGRRVQTLARLASGRGGLPRLVLISAGAALQQVPAPASWVGSGTRFSVGAALGKAAVRRVLQQLGYHAGETVADPGDVAVHDHVIDVYPAGAAQPARLSIEHGRIAAIHRLDPISQRRMEPMMRLDVYPAREFTLDGAEGAGADLVPVFDYVPEFALFVDRGVEARWAELREQIDDAYQSSRHLRRRGAAAEGTLPPPDRLYLPPHVAAAAITRGAAVQPHGTAEPAPPRVQDLVARAQRAGGSVVIAAPTDPAKLARSLGKRGVAARAANSWPDAVSGGVTCWPLEIDGGFETEGVLVLQAAHLVRSEAPSGASSLLTDHPPRIGDVVVHAEHGAARLTGLKHVEADGRPGERLALAFAAETELLVDPLEFDRIWRYGAVGAVDRIGGEAWRLRRASIEREIEDMAARLAEQAAARAVMRAPVLAADRAVYERLSLRFPYALSGDQRAAVDAVLADLRRGSPMNRLVCGDVGFGKTEVALRATAAAALSGWQVAVVASTTVLARQHLDTFRCRFAGTAVRVEPLSAGPEGRMTRRGLADGSIGVVIGTQALAGQGLQFAKLGLVIIDEEQRLGEEQKHALCDHVGTLGAVHTLVLTATPIPRTMQAAMIGLREVSVIATAPVNRQATRTVVLPFDPAVLRDALMREHARGGQSFIVCPRISDLAAMADQVAELAPELHLVQAHGRMRAEALEAAVVGFAAGTGDVLLATNIIEAGLDIPRANTLVVMRPDRFGLAQLHQVRGRVGRGVRRGTAYLMTDPDRKLAKSTLARLRALEEASTLGAGIAISAADMEQRGAGELFGSVQAGHVSALGTELYQHLLTQAVRARQGGAAMTAAPVVNVGLDGRIPAEYVHDADLRISLYRRLARLQDIDAVDGFAEELADRFGPPPLETELLLALARLRCVGSAAGVKQLESGPRGVSITLHDDGTPGSLAIRLSELAERMGGVVRDTRLVVPLDHAPPHHRVAELIGMLSHTAVPVLT